MKKLILTMAALLSYSASSYATTMKLKGYLLCGQGCVKVVCDQTVSFDESVIVHPNGSPLAVKLQQEKAKGEIISLGDDKFKLNAYRGGVKVESVEVEFKKTKGIINPEKVVLFGLLGQSFELTLEIIEN